MQDPSMGGMPPDAQGGGGQEQAMQQIVGALVQLGDPQLIAKVAQAAIQILQNQGSPAQQG